MRLIIKLTTMKNLFYLLVLLPFLSFSQENKTTLTAENINHEVKVYFHKTNKVSNQTKALKQKYASKHFYDKVGRLTKKENYGDDATLDTKEIYTYKNNKISSVEIQGSTGETNKVTHYKYNKKGLLILKDKVNNKGETEHKTFLTYNNQGVLLLMKKNIPSINYTITESYVYNALNQIIVKEKKARIGATKEKYVYNDAGSILKKSEYNAVGELFSVINYEYNQHNDKISLKKYDTDGNLTYYEKYEFRYDSKGNWIEKISFEKGEKVSEEIREFTYY